MELIKRLNFVKVEIMGIRTERLINKAYYFIENCKYDEAIKVLKQAISIDQDNQELYAYLGEVYFFNRQYDQAKKTFDIRDKLLIEKNYLTPYIKGFRGCILLEEGEVEEACNLLEEVTSKKVMEPQIYYSLGIAEMLKGNLKKSKNLLYKTKTMDPSFLYNKIKGLMEKQEDKKS